jgi:radical SAM protein with 4Fe4S-binding SPASM domain
MTVPLRPDLAFQRYATESGEVLAAYALSENSFMVLEDDAAIFVGRVLDGAEPLDLVAEVENSHGAAVAQDVAQFLDTTLPTFLGSPVVGEAVRKPVSGAGQGPEERAEEETFFVRCSMERRFATATWELGYGCNLRCVHCYNPHHEAGAQLDTAQWLDLLDQGRELGLLRLGLTGGEAGIHPGLWPILEKARRLHLAVDLLTNGLVFSDRGQAARLAATFPRSVQCSLYGATPETHEAITGVAGSWRRTIQCLEHFADLGVPTALKCPAMTSNYLEIPQVAQLASRLGAFLQVDLSITARNDGEASPTRFRLDEPQLAWLLAQPGLPFYQGLERIDPEALTEWDPEWAVCGAGSNGLHVQPDGTVVPCLSLMLPVGNLRTDSLKAVWEGEPLSRWTNAKRMDCLECAGCADAAFCALCPGISLNDHGDYLRSNANDCGIARARAAAARQPSSTREPRRT